MLSMKICINQVVTWNSIQVAKRENTTKVLEVEAFNWCWWSSEDPDRWNDWIGEIILMYANMYRAELTILINAKWNSKQKAFSEVGYLNNDEIHSTPSIGTRYHVISIEALA